MFPFCEMNLGRQFKKMSVVRLQQFRTTVQMEGVEDCKLQRAGVYFDFLLPAWADASFSTFDLSQLRLPWWWGFTRRGCWRLRAEPSPCGVRCREILRTISTGPEKTAGPSPAAPTDASKVRCSAVISPSCDHVTPVVHWHQALQHMCDFSCLCCPGAELYFPKVQPSDAGVYVCTCRDQRSSNRSRAEIVVTSEFQLHRRYYSTIDLFSFRFSENIHIISEKESRPSSVVKSSLMPFNEFAITGVQYLADGAYSAVILFCGFFFFSIKFSFFSPKVQKQLAVSKQMWLALCFVRVESRWILPLPFLRHPIQTHWGDSGGA